MPVGGEPVVHVGEKRRAAVVVDHLLHVTAPGELGGLATTGEPLQRTLSGVHQDDLAEHRAIVMGDGFEPLDLAEPSEVLRHDDVAAGPQMGAGHAQRDRSDELTCLGETVPPAADEAAHLVDVEVERPRVVVDVHVGKRRLPDARRAVGMNETRHPESLVGERGCNCIACNDARVT